MSNIDYGFIHKLMSLEYDEHDRKVLPREYLDLSVHIAMERADMRENWKVFDYLMSKYGEVLSKHIELCGPIFTWNHKSR